MITRPDRDQPTTLTVNGQLTTIAADETTPLIRALRNHLGLTGVRTGCDIGECGACTVLADGISIRPCITPLGEAAGKGIITPEGLGTPEAPHPVQRAFLEEQAAQCGYCVNGMIMSVVGAIDADLIASEDDARKVLDEHICRCGTHVRLLRAAQRAAGLHPEPPLSHVLTEAPVSATAGLPPAIIRFPRIERWLALTAHGTVEVLAPKVELGQGIHGAFRRVVAAQIGLPLACVRVAATDTSISVDLGHTAGSNSIEEGGIALAFAAVALRRVLISRAAAVLSVPHDEVSLSASGARGRDNGEIVALSELATPGVSGEILVDDTPDWRRRPEGEPDARDDLRAKLTGASAYVHDFMPDGVLHARALLPPTYDAAPLEVPDLEALASDSGARRIVRDGRLFIVIAEDEVVAVRALARLARAVTWDAPGRPESVDVLASMRQLPGVEHVTRHDEITADRLATWPVVAASYTKPYEAHAPMAPSAAVSLVTDDEIRVWSHTQSPYPLRAELAALLQVPPERVVVSHRPGPGCYGMNGADDVAALAALAARAVPGVPIRLQLSMDDEFAWDPYGSAMVADLTGAVDADGRITAWHHRSWTDAHYARPDGTGDRLLASWLREGGRERPWTGPHEGGWRDSLPPYDLDAVDAVTTHVRGPLRTGSLRSLGSYMHVFAVESFMDELAEAADRDPVDFRLGHLTDPRARRVIEVAADAAGWIPHVGPSGRGLGLAYARYKASKAYAAQAVEVRVDQEAGTFRVERIVVACDAGTVISPDGLRNQLEGASLQSLSRALAEELHVTSAGVRERSLADYPVLRFRDVPKVEVILLDRPGSPPLGAGESATPSLAAALANAIDDAIGVRLRDLPFTADRLQQRLLTMDERDAARVRL